METSNLCMVRASVLMIVEYIPWIVRRVCIIVLGMAQKQLALLLGNISRNVRAGRVAVGLSQERLAFEAGIDRTYVSQIERGVCNPSLEVLVKVSKVLKVEVVDLLS